MDGFIQRIQKGSPVGLGLSLKLKLEIWVVPRRERNLASSFALTFSRKSEMTYAFFLDDFILNWRVTSRRGIKDLNRT